MERMERVRYTENSSCARWIGVSLSFEEECLDRSIPLGETHLRELIRE